MFKLNSDIHKIAYEGVSLFSLLLEQHFSNSSIVLASNLAEPDSVVVFNLSPALLSTCYNSALPSLKRTNQRYKTISLFSFGLSCLYKY